MTDTKQYQTKLYYLLSATAGILFVYIAIPIIDERAALAVPESILKPVFMISPSIALSIIEMDQLVSVVTFSLHQLMKFIF